jgi:hypothetical protein
MLSQVHAAAPGLLRISNFSAYQNRRPILQDNILFLSNMSMCTVKAIPCCSFFPRYWLSGFQTTMLRSSMCHPDLTSHDPGVQQHSIKFCRHALSLTGTESTFTFWTVELESDLYHGVMLALCYTFNMEHH